MNCLGANEPILPEGQLKALGQIGEQENKEGDKVSLIMDDMDAYFDRHRFVKIKSVLDDMRKQDVVGNLRELASDLKNEKGLTIAQCEYWSDTLDRWAEDLVDPACCGACPGCKSKGSLPPSIVLEVLQILEGEMNLREETRVGEQARPSLTADNYKQEAMKLAKTQNVLRERVDQGPRSHSRVARCRVRLRQGVAPARSGQGRDARGAGHLGAARTRARPPSVPRPRSSNCCCSPSGSIPKAAVAEADRTPAAAEAEPRMTPL